MIKNELEESPFMSAKTKNRVLDVKLEKETNQWSSCCCKSTDKRLLQYIVQISVIGSGLLFSGVQLVLVKDCPDQQAYLGLFTMLIGLLIPTPVQKTK